MSSVVPSSIRTIRPSGFVGRTSEYVNPFFSVPIWSMLSIFHECQNKVTNALLRQLHKNLMRAMFGNAVECKIPLVFLFCWDYFPFSLTKSNRHKLCLWRSFVPLPVAVNLASVLAVARSSKTEAKTRLQYFRVQHLQQKTMSCVLFKLLVRHAPKTSRDR